MDQVSLRQKKGQGIDSSLPLLVCRFARAITPREDSRHAK